MKKFKILNQDMTPPFKNNMTYEIGKQYVCNNFDTSNEECSYGYYATDIDGLIYTNLSNNKRVFEVEVSGKEKVFDTYKQRFEKIELIKEIPTLELKRIVKNQSDKMDWNYYGALFPFNPFSIKPTININTAQKYLKQWDSVRDSVRDSVWDSVRDSVRDSVWDSVRNSVRNSVRDFVRNFVRNFVRASVRASVRDSVGDSVGAYQGYLFPGIKNWKYIKHTPGIYPYQPSIDLWINGLFPVYYQNNWHLYSKDGKWAELQ